MRSFDITFRGEEKTVVVDQYDVDYDTNAVDVSWHFEGVTPEQHDALNVTAAEEDAIIDEISEYLADHADDQD